MTSIDDKVLDRRIRSTRSQKPIVVRCRHCSKPQVLAVPRVDASDGQAAHRCVGCEQWFPIRREDAVALGVAVVQDSPASSRQHESARMYEHGV
jgi:hypothetical protein